MAIKVFIYSLLVLSLISLFTSISNEVDESSQKDIPLITFSNSTMYTLNNKEVTRIVQSTESIRYKSRDEMFEGVFYLRAKSKDRNDLADVISADFIEKKGPKLKFVNSVKYNRADFVTLKTDILHYNLDTKIVYNNKPFIGTYYNDSLNGTELYMDTNKTHFKSKNAHFEIDLEKKE